MKRPTFLYWHLRGINRSVKSERQRFFRLYPLAVLVCGFGLGYAFQVDRNARRELEEPVVVQDTLEAYKTRLRAGSVGTTRAGEPVREKNGHPQFVW